MNYLDQILGTGDTVLKAQKAYGIRYMSGMWEEGKDFQKLGIPGGYFSIQDKDTLKDMGYTHIEFYTRHGISLERFPL